MSSSVPAFLNIPVKAIQVSLISVIGISSEPWNNPLLYPVVPPALPPAPLQRDVKWEVILTVGAQQHSAYNTRAPGAYDGQDISVGQWIANSNTGQAWKIMSIESKTSSSVTAVVEDMFRYNIFRDSTQLGNGAPISGTYIVFSLSDSGIPIIDPIPSGGVSSSFGTNILSRFEYINQQFDYPLYQSSNTFSLGDVVAADATTNSFVLADAANKLVVGRVTSISNTTPGWFTINPVQKIVDDLNALPGDLCDVIYTSTTIPGDITATPGGAELYIKLRNQTSSVSLATAIGPTSPGNVFQLNGVDVTVGGTGTDADVVSAVNPLSAQTGVTSTLVLFFTSVQTSNALVTTTYGEPALWATSSPADATINGVTVVFNIPSTDPGYEDYSRPAQMAQAINAAGIPNIVASAPTTLVLLIKNLIGGPITIVNGTSDINGVPFAGTNSGSGLVLSTPASTDYRLQFTAVDARAINFLNVVGDTVGDFGLVSVENGVKACGLYIESGLRTAATTVVLNLTALYALSPIIGDQAYVIDSDDGSGNNVGEWSMWLYDGSVWIETSNEDSASTDAKSLEYTVTTASPGTINIGKISTGRRVSLITVEVITPFDGTPTLDIGYQVDNPVPPPPVPAGLMTNNIIDLAVADTYTTYTDILFGTDTVQGDVTITATFSLGSATVGEAQIIVSYV